jgi:deoxyadenosine/deoxycytidine kinase/NTP pyrophosphatase (non-canonical NTP hydrolase)
LPLPSEEVKLPENVYIAIEGAIGVGKTTLARLIRDEFDAELLLEVFEENPFLTDFYADRERYAFQTQIFFLLSRYRQQQRVVPETLQRSSLISDYTFSKDRLFAHLNLKDDELEMYERVHAILAEKIVLPDLIVYLKADTDTLMKRIAFRDRTYEREMDRGYLEALRTAYERFFADYDQVPVLPIDTNKLDFVHNPQDLAQVVGHIKSALEKGTYQRPLPRIGPALDEADRAIFIEGRRRLGDFQRWHLALDKEKGLLTDLYFNFICLTEEVGDLGAELRGVWTAQEELYKKVGNRREALDRAIQERLPELRQELADCLAFLLRLANYTGIDLEEAFLSEMKKDKRRIQG